MRLNKKGKSLGRSSKCGPQKSFTVWRFAHCSTGKRGDMRRVGAPACTLFGPCYHRQQCVTWSFHVLCKLPNSDPQADYHLHTFLSKKFHQMVGMPGLGSRLSTCCPTKRSKWRSSQHTSADQTPILCVPVASPRFKQKGRVYM